MTQACKKKTCKDEEGTIFSIGGTKNTTIIKFLTGALMSSKLQCVELGMIEQYLAVRFEIQILALSKL